MVHCILKGMCIYLYIHKTRSEEEEATKALVEQQQNSSDGDGSRYDRLFEWDMKASLILFIFSFHLLSLHFASLHFTSFRSFVCMSGMTHEFSMNVSINQSLSAHIRCYCVQRIFLTSLRPRHCCCCCYFSSSSLTLSLLFLLKSNSKIICTVRFYCLLVFTYYSQLLAVSRCLFLKIDIIDFFYCVQSVQSWKRQRKKNRSSTYFYIVLRVCCGQKGSKTRTKRIE